MIITALSQGKRELCHGRVKEGRVMLGRQNPGTHQPLSQQKVTFLGWNYLREAGARCSGMVPSLLAPCGHPMSGS